MNTNHTIKPDSELAIKGQALIAAAYDYWECHQKEAGGGAVVWLEDNSGHFVLFTRGEYKEEIMQAANRECRNATHMFEPFTLSSQTEEVKP